MERARLPTSAANSSTAPQTTTKGTDAQVRAEPTTSPMTQQIITTGAIPTKPAAICPRRSWDRVRGNSDRRAGSIVSSTPPPSTGANHQPNTIPAERSTRLRCWASASQYTRRPSAMPTPTPAATSANRREKTKPTRAHVDRVILRTPLTTNRAYSSTNTRVGLTGPAPAIRSIRPRGAPLRLRR